MKHVMSPLLIQVLLEYYYLAYPEIDGENIRRRKFDDKFMQGLHKKGLLDASESPDCMFELSDKGKVYISTLLDVPLPIPAWVVDFSTMETDCEIN